MSIFLNGRTHKLEMPIYKTLEDKDNNIQRLRGSLTFISELQRHLEAVFFDADLETWRLATMLLVVDEHKRTNMKTGEDEYCKGRMCSASLMRAEPRQKLGFTL